MTTVMKDSQEGQPECVRNSCVLAATSHWARQLKCSIYSLGGYRARAINIQLCRKTQLTEHIEDGRDFVPCSSKDYSCLAACVQT